MLWRKPAALLDDVGRLIAGLQEVQPAQVEGVVRARTSGGEQHRITAFYAAMKGARASNRTPLYEAARKAKEGAWKATRGAGLDNWSFSYAAFEAALALGTRDLLKAEDYQRLIAPMAVAMPWLLPTQSAEELGRR